MIKSETNHLAIKVNSEALSKFPSISSVNSSPFRSLSPSVRNTNTKSKLDHLPLLTRVKSPRLAPTRTHKLKPSKILQKPFGKVKITAANSFSNQRSKNLDRIRIDLDVKRPIFFAEEAWPSSSYFGLFSGYDGKFSPCFLKDSLHDYIYTSKHFPYKLKDSLIQGFQQCDSKLLELNDENFDFSGSSATVFLLIGNQGIIGNVGNSRAILSSNGGNVVNVLTTEDTIYNEEEIKRVHELGKLHSEYYLDENGDKVYKGKYRINPGGLTVTRCLGSPQAKLEQFGGAPGLILNTPHVKSFKIKKDFDFILLASPAFFETLSCIDMVSSIWQGIRDDSESVEEKLENGLRNLMSLAVESQCNGNLTAVLIGFASLINNCK